MRRFKQMMWLVATLVATLALAGCLVRASPGLRAHGVVHVGGGGGHHHPPGHGQGHGEGRHHDH